MSWGKLLDAVRLDGVNPPIYYLAVKAFTTPFELNEFTLRILSSLAHIVGIFFAMAIGYKVGGRAGSLTGGWFWAFHPMTIWYARDARPYALTAALAAVLAAMFITLRRRNSYAAWVGVILIITLGLLTHYFFLVLTITLLAIAFIDVKRNPIFFRRWALAALISFVPLTIWLIWYFTQPQPSLGIGWIQQPDLLEIPATLWNLISGFGGVNSWPAMLFGGLVFLLVITAIIHDGERWSNLRTFILGILLPVGATWFISQRRPVYHDRYFIVLLPMVLILVSSGAERVWDEIKRRFASRERRLITIAIILCVGAIGLLSGYQVHIDEKYAKENWRDLTDFIKQDPEKRASIWLSEPEALLPLTYYNIDEIDPIFLEDSSSCRTECWWILRQPYTATHAFSQAVSSPDRVDEIQIPKGCSVERYWQDYSGLELWDVSCEEP
jgi:uncharacterized membrane protein